MRKRLVPPTLFVVDAFHVRPFLAFALHQSIEQRQSERLAGDPGTQKSPGFRLTCLNSNGRPAVKQELFRRFIRGVAGARYQTSARPASATTLCTTRSQQRSCV